MYKYENENSERDYYLEAKRRTRKNVIKISTIILLVIGVLALIKGTHIIKPGYVGIVYSLNGGIKDEILEQGFRFVNPLSKVNQYSVATEQAYLSRDKKEGSKDDDSFIIPTSDGKTVNVDLEFSYHFDAERLPETFTRFKGQKGKTIEETFIRGKMKSWSSDVTSKFSVLDIYGEKRSELNKAVLDYTKEKFDEYGIIIDSVNFTRISLDEQTEQAIQQRITKQQELEALKIESEKAKVEAERLAKEAQGKAEAKLIEANAEAEANKIIQQSITSELLKKMEMEARIKHGWVEVQGGTPIVDTRNNNQ